MSAFQNALFEFDAAPGSSGSSEEGHDAGDVGYINAYGSQLQ
jgi:hypothetical protein